MWLWGGEEKTVANRLAVFEDRIIHEAQPPIDRRTIAKIESRCAGPLPEPLVKLWKTAFGGRLDYNLEVELRGLYVEFSFVELFYPKSGGYHDFWGWIDHEMALRAQAAHEQGRSFDGKLRYLPIGGFEHSERVYVCVEPGEKYGSVWVWMQGLPPAWILRLHQDSGGRIADDLAGLFHSLHLEEDPFVKGSDETRHGLDLVDRVRALEQTDRARSLDLRTLVSDAVLHWRDAVSAGTVADSPLMTRVALLDAARRGNRPALERLEAQGCPLATPLRGGGNALDFALASGHIETAEWLLWKGIVSENAVTNGAQYAPPGLVARLFAAGGRAEPLAARLACVAGRHESAVLIAKALSKEERQQLITELDPTKFGAKWREVKALREACLAMP